MALKTKAEASGKGRKLNAKTLTRLLAKKESIEKAIARQQKKLQRVNVRLAEFGDLLKSSVQNQP